MKYNRSICPIYPNSLSEAQNPNWNIMAMLWISLGIYLIQMGRHHKNLKRLKQIETLGSDAISTDYSTYFSQNPFPFMILKKIQPQMKPAKETQIPRLVYESNETTKKRNIEEIYFYDNFGDLLTAEFDSSSKVLTVQGTGAMIKLAQMPWNDQSSNIDVIVIGTGVTKISDSAFNSVSARSLDILTPSSLMTIGSEAFYLCDKIETLTIPNSVTTIMGSAFCYCDGLTSVKIYSSIITLGTSVFYLCKNLKVVKYCGKTAQSQPIFSLSPVTEVLVSGNYPTDTFCGLTAKKVLGPSDCPIIDEEKKITFAYLNYLDRKYYYILLMPHWLLVFLC